MFVMSKKESQRRSYTRPMRFAFKSILFLMILVTCHSIAARDDDYHYTISDAKAILAVTTGPADSLILVFSMNQIDSDETASASPAIIDLDRGKISRFGKIESPAADLNAVWRKDGKHVLFGTNDGIFEADAERLEEKPKRIVASKSTNGIALSRNESRLAFWNWNNKSLQLVVRGAATSKLIRAWTLPFDYGSEAAGFGIAFEDENTVYAQTFDRQFGTPLKRFNVATGKIETIDRDCMALAPGATAIYYIENSKPAPLLKKISAGKVETLSSIGGYDGLRTSADGRWIALWGRRKSAILDTSSDEISVKSTCESMAMLSNGTPLYVKGAELSSNPAVCAKSR